MGIIAWLLFGALVGWIASMIMRTDEEQGALANIVVGIVGAIIGGFLANTLFDSPGVTGFNVRSILLSIVGAVVLLFVIRLFSGDRSRTNV